MENKAGLLVNKKQCKTCIYRTDTGLNWDIEELEDQVKDKHVGFKGHRICHTNGTKKNPVCCRGFWDRHKDEFPAGQVAQRLGVVIEV